MSRFKVGDKIRCIRGTDGYLTVGKIYEVIDKPMYNSQTTVAIAFCDEAADWSAWDANRFELVEDPTQTLIDKANEGLKALAELAKRKDIEISGVVYPKEFLQLNDSIIVSNILDKDQRARTVRLEPKPAFEPFTTSEGWLVKLEGNKLQVGCFEFEAENAKDALVVLVEKVQAQFRDFVATRTGIAHSGKKLNWADAERILEALKKAGVK